MLRILMLAITVILFGVATFVQPLPGFCYVHYILNGAFLFFVFCLLTGHKKAFVVSVVLLVICAGFVINSLAGYRVLCFLYMPPYLLSVGMVLLLKKCWTIELASCHKHKEEMAEEINGLQARLDNKQMTLINLEQQVNDIIDLFEVAKDFNECLTVDSVVSILQNRVSQYLKCEKSVLVMLRDELQSALDYKAYILTKDETAFIEASGETDTTGGRDEIDACMQVCLDHKDTIRIDYPIQYEDYFDGDKNKVKYPFWIFPLIVENKLIASYLVYGAHVNDFPKFSIIASQLALQIKKIKLYEDVRELSITDGLTKFFLRRHFTERFEEELKRSIKYGHSLSVLMIDVDHFKLYNDNYGHLVGDATLREVANIIRDCIRKVDLTGRYGGEEFILVLPETDKDGGIDAAERIRSSVARKSLKVYDEETRITISVGVSSFPEDVAFECKTYSPEIMDALIKKADDNLYRAKQDGRNRVVF